MVLLLWQRAGALTQQVEDLIPVDKPPAPPCPSSPVGSPDALSTSQQDGEGSPLPSALDPVEEDDGGDMAESPLQGEGEEHGPGQGQGPGQGLLAEDGDGARARSPHDPPVGGALQAPPATGAGEAPEALVVVVGSAFPPPGAAAPLVSGSGSSPVRPYTGPTASPGGAADDWLTALQRTIAQPPTVQQRMQQQCEGRGGGVLVSDLVHAMVEDSDDDVLGGGPSTPSRLTSPDRPRAKRRAKGAARVGPMTMLLEKVRRCRRSCDSCCSFPLHTAPPSPPLARVCHVRI